MDIAKPLAKEPEVLLADESLRNLDFMIERGIPEIMKAMTSKE